MRRKLIRNELGQHAVLFKRHWWERWKGFDYLGKVAKKDEVHWSKTKEEAVEVFGKWLQA